MASQYGQVRVSHQDKTCAQQQRNKNLKSSAGWWARGQKGGDFAQSRNIISPRVEPTVAVLPCPSEGGADCSTTLPQIAQPISSVGWGFARVNVPPIRNAESLSPEIHPCVPSQ
mmetsp:Transcript_24344/g.40011  ORF Transcript_24344/g.40011 Transcript_24344/m.40011 type:complete len:114 (-) Transcript_24344:1110-1451(-)